MTGEHDHLWPSEEEAPKPELDELDRRAWIDALGKYSDETRRECLAAEADLSRAIDRTQKARARMLRVVDLLESMVRLHAMRKGAR